MTVSVENDYAQLARLRSVGHQQIFRTADTASRVRVPKGVCICEVCDPSVSFPGGRPAFERHYIAKHYDPP